MERYFFSEKLAVNPSNQMPGLIENVNSSTSMFNGYCRRSVTNKGVWISMNPTCNVTIFIINVKASTSMNSYCCYHDIASIRRIRYPAGCYAPCRAGFGTVRFAFAKCLSGVPSTGSGTLFINHCCRGFLKFLWPKVP